MSKPPQKRVNTSLLRAYSTLRPKTRCWPTCSPHWHTSSPDSGVKRRFVEEISGCCVCNFFGQVYESIWNVGKDMRLKNQEHTFWFGSMNWRFYASEVANLWSFRQLSLELIRAKRRRVFRVEMGKSFVILITKLSSWAQRRICIVPAPMYKSRE